MGAYPTEHREPWIDENGFLRAQPGEGRRTKKIVRHSLDVAAALTADGRKQTIIDARSMTEAGPEAWLEFVTRIETVASAMAVLVSDETTPTMSIFMERINSLLLPAALFTDEDSAVAWLRSLET